MTVPIAKSLVIGEYTEPQSPLQAAEASNACYCLWTFIEARCSRIALATIGLDFEPLFVHNPTDLGLAEGIGQPLNLIV
jgi:hypothetical protein